MFIALHVSRRAVYASLGKNDLLFVTRSIYIYKPPLYAFDFVRRAMQWKQQRFGLPTIIFDR